MNQACECVYNFVFVFIVAIHRGLNMLKGLKMLCLIIQVTYHDFLYLLII